VHGRRVDRVVGLPFTSRLGIRFWSVLWYSDLHVFSTGTLFLCKSAALKGGDDQLLLLISSRISKKKLHWQP
jgi:hypothetical protein